MEEEEEPWQPPELPMLAWPVLQARTGLVYDQQMMDHYNLWDRYAVREPGEVGTWGGTLPGRDPPPSNTKPPASGSPHPTPSHHPEMPQRILRIMRRLEELGLAGRCLALPARPATDAELLACHRSDPGSWGWGCGMGVLGAGAWACLSGTRSCCDTWEGHGGDRVT